MEKIRVIKITQFYLLKYILFLVYSFLGYRHILTGKGRIIVKLRYSSKQRMKKHLKTIYKLYDKGIVDDKYVYSRKNAFYNHIKTTNESPNLKVSTIPSK